MKRLPEQQSLIAQTAEILRETIAAGSWREFLPGERELANELRVSRPTLRAALGLLQREGEIEVAHGKRRRIRPASIRRRTVRVAKRVAVLSPLPLHRLPPFVMFWIDELRQRLSEAGFDLHIHVSQLTQTRRPQKQLAQIVEDVSAAAWVLLLSSEQIQRWYVARGIPCLIAGSSFEGVDLPSIDVDAHAACHHAASMFVSKGHRRIALLLPSAATAGDQASEAGFLAGARAVARNEASALVIHHDGTVAGVCRSIDRLLAQSPALSAIIVARSAHALTAFTYLQQRGVKLPQQCAFIARDNDAFLEFTVPSITRYAADPALFARRVSRLVLALAKGRPIARRQTLLIPHLIQGETV